jgi:hypothetical protein
MSLLFREKDPKYNIVRSDIHCVLLVPNADTRIALRNMEQDQCGFCAPEVVALESRPELERDWIPSLVRKSTLDRITAIPLIWDQRVMTVACSVLDDIRASRGIRTSPEARFWAELVMPRRTAVSQIDGPTINRKTTDEAVATLNHELGKLGRFLVLNKDRRQCHVLKTD